MDYDPREVNVSVSRKTDGGDITIRLSVKRLGVTGEGAGADYAAAKAKAVADLDGAVARAKLKSA